MIVRKFSILCAAMQLSVIMANKSQKHTSGRLPEHYVIPAKFKQSWDNNFEEWLEDRRVLKERSHETPQRFRAMQEENATETKDTSETTDAPAPGDNGDDGKVFKHFIPHNETRTCSADTHSSPFNKQVRGVNLGSWLVLEPWITPSIFYQFLGKDEGTTAMDMYTFCEVLGAEEGNRQLRNHWSKWVTKDIIKELAGLQVNSLRLPVGDWMYEPYGPYVGCTDGATDFVDQLLDWAKEFEMSVLIDIHGMKDSQNGFDNSGQSMGLQFTSKLNTYPAGLVTFEHWPIRRAHWMGEFDIKNFTYHEINYDNINHSLRVIQKIAETYKDHPAVLGLEPVNEPWEFTPIEELKQFYWEGYLIVKRYAPSWKYVIHDSFRFDVKVWGGFMDGCPDRAIDAHMYQAWRNPASAVTFYSDACNAKYGIAAMERAFGPVIVGEWSLATDNCAMWLNGFNDNLPGFPMLPCKYIPCSEESYLGPNQTGTPLDPGKSLQGPYGSGVSGPSWGLCPVGRDWLKEHSGDPMTGVDWRLAPPSAPENRDGTDEVMTLLARKKINTYMITGHGFYFWNFRTELDEPHWSYLGAAKKGWIPTGSFSDVHIRQACRREDEGQYTCIARRDVLDDSLRSGMKYALNVDGLDQEYLDDLHGEDLQDEGDKVYSRFFRRHFAQGATCDFGGTAQLVAGNSTDMDDDEFDDDWVDDFRLDYSKGIGRVQKIGWLIGGLAFGALVGFVVAARTNRRFSRAVRKSVLVRHLRPSTLKLIAPDLDLDEGEPLYSNRR